MAKVLINSSQPIATFNYSLNPIGKNGNFIADRQGKLAREWMKLFGRDPNFRLDRIPMTKLKGHVISAKVKTVVTNGKQKKLHEANHYSVIEELLGIEV